MGRQSVQSGPLSVPGRLHCRTRHPQPTLDELLAEVNAEHQSIQRGELDPTPYLRTSLSKEDWPKAAEYAAATYSDYDPDKLLTHDEAVEDVNYLFDACYYAYGLYDYFGGHETFDAARQAMLQDLEGKGTVTCQELEELMVSHLGFIKDGHFSINQNHPAPFQIPFFFRQTAFLKTGDGYQTVNGKVVESVENHEDWMSCSSGLSRSRGSWSITRCC